MLFGEFLALDHSIATEFFCGRQIGLQQVFAA